MYFKHCLTVTVTNVFYFDHTIPDWHHQEAQYQTFVYLLLLTVLLEQCFIFSAG